MQHCHVRHCYAVRPIAMSVTLLRPNVCLQAVPLLLAAFSGAAADIAAASKHDIAVTLAPAGVLYGTVKASKGSAGTGAAAGKAAASKNASRRGKDAEEVTHTL